MRQGDKTNGTIGRIVVETPWGLRKLKDLLGGQFQAAQIGGGESAGAIYETLFVDCTNLIQNGHGVFAGAGDW